MALILASHAAVALHVTRALSAERPRSAQLQEALQSRDVIGQAKGILTERRGYTPQEAFDVLRRTSQDLNADPEAFEMLVKTSQDTNMKLAHVARWLSEETEDGARSRARSL